MIDLSKRLKRQTHKPLSDDYVPISETLETDKLGVNQLVDTPPLTYSDTDYSVFSVHNLLDNNPSLLHEVGPLHIDNVDVVNSFVDNVTARMINDNSFNSTNNNIIDNNG